VYQILLALHLLFAIFAIGPLVHAATTAGRGLRRSDAGATAASARTLRIYAYASVLVVIVGMALMSVKDPVHPSRHLGEIGQLWIWLSLVLWGAAIAMTLAVLVPSLTRATKAIAESGSSGSALTARVAATGGLIGLIFAGIVFLMVYQPGH
jgi:hypothetical protein